MSKELPASKTARVIPSRIWFEGARAVWRSLAFRERVLLLMAAMVPALDHVSRLASLGVMMKAVSQGVKHHLDLETRLWLGVTILVSSGLAILIKMLSTWVKKNLKILFTGILRRIYGRMMAETISMPTAEREREVERLLREERSFMTSTLSAMSELVEFVAIIIIVVSLLGVLTWFNWIVGVIILGAGFLALLILRAKIRKKPVREEDTSLEDERKRTSLSLARISKCRNDPEPLVETYANNQFDRLYFAGEDVKSSLERKISLILNWGTALLMTGVFLLISSEGAINGEKIVWIVVFIFGLRMVTTFGKRAIVSWSKVLGEKATLMTLARASVTAAPKSREKDQGPGEDDGESGSARGPLARIVDYSFSGLNGSEIVSREPLLLEMTMEAEEEIEGFYWSFAITREEGFSYLMSKTSEDCGIKWTLPAGRSTFRMVTGPIWLPAGTYSAMIGAAEGERLLDLVGTADSPISVRVLPDEAAKRSVQTRAACDVVLVDVEWDIDFHHEKPDVERYRPVSTINQ